MFKLYFKRGTLVILTVLLVLLFFSSFALVFALSYSSLSIKDIVYYVLSGLLVIASCSLLFKYSKSSLFRDVHRYMVVSLLFLILYAVFDLWIRSLYILIPFDDPVYYLIKIRIFLSFIVIASFFAEEYNETFYKKAASDLVNVLLFFLSFVFAVILPSSLNLNIHMFVIMLTLCIITSFHSLIYTLASEDLTSKNKVLNVLCCVFEIVGSMLYTVFSDKIVSFVGLAFLLFAFIVFSLKTISE